jgi:protein tyrosine phosphatase (PTP) superfamily phosphohydrolase (DUF442 family)
MTCKPIFRPLQAAALLAGLLLTLPPLGAQTPSPAAPSGPPAGLLSNQHQPLPGLLTGGAPSSAEGFRAIAQAGYRTFIDLRSDAEVTPETRAAAEAAGLVYRRVPVGGEAELDLASARALDALLDDEANRPAAVACGSGNRVGALLALRSFWLDGAPPEEALALGLRAGLTKLEPSVRQLLGLPRP